jgi:hypothetical protein
MIPSQTFFEYHLRNATHEPELLQTAPDCKHQDTLERPSVPDLMCARGAALFDQRISEAGNRYRFVDLLYDSGNFHGVNFLHPAITNLSYLDDIMPLEPWNHVKSGDDCHTFFQGVHNQRRRNECELCGIVCENDKSKLPDHGILFRIMRICLAGDARPMLQSLDQRDFPLFTSDE